MFRIKRTKSEPRGPMDSITGPRPWRVHYAARLDPSGNVDKWVHDEAHALSVTREQGEQVVACYEERPAAGRISLQEIIVEPPEPVRAEAAVEPEPESESTPEPAAPEPEPGADIPEVKSLEELPMAVPPTRVEKPARKGRQ